MARSRRSRASSTPRFDAASSSTTSRLAAPVQMRVHESHSPHGSPATPLDCRRSQFSAIARMRAAVVFPTPRGPANRYPWATRPPATAPRSAAARLSWAIRSENCLGRYLRAKAIMGGNLTRKWERGTRNSEGDVVPREAGLDVPRSDFRVPPLTTRFAFPLPRLDVECPRLPAATPDIA